MACGELTTVNAPAGSIAHEQRKLLLWAGLACLGLWGLLAVPFFRGHVYVADDLGQYHLPARAFYAEQLRRGEAFDWMPSLFAGFFLTGDGQAGTYHPAHWLLYRWLPLGAAFDLEILLSYLVLLAGTYRLLERLLEDRAAALCGGMFFTFSGFCLLHFVHVNAIAVVAHLPWLLLACDVALAAGERRKVASALVGVGLVVASMLLLGYPQYVWFTLLATVGFVLWRRAQLGARWRALAALAVAGTVGAACAAIQLLPTIDALQLSTRSGVDADFLNSGSLHPLNLVQLVAPYLFATRVVGQNTHELGLYAGAVPLVLCVWLVGQRQRLGPLRPLARAAAVLGGIALLLAMGEYGGLYRLQQLVPLANHFRFPCRAIVLVHLSMAVGAAIAVKLLLAPAERVATIPGRSRSLLLAVVAASVALAVVGPIAWSQFTAPLPLVWAGPLLIGVAVFLVLMAERKARWARALVVIFAAIDLGLYGLSYAVWPHTAPLAQFAADAAAPPLAGEHRVAAYLGPGRDTPRVGNRMLLAGVERADGYAGLEPARLLDYRKCESLRAAGVRWVLGSAGASMPIGLEPAGEDWWQVPDTLPRLRLATKVVHGTSDVALPSDPTAALVDRPVELPPSDPGTLSMLVDRPGRLDLAVSTPRTQLLVVADSFHPGWRAQVAGQDAPVVRVNGDFMGCVVPAGEHLVCWRFEPDSLRLGRCVSGFGLGLMLCLFVVARRWPLARA